MPVSPAVTATPETRLAPDRPSKARTNYLRDFLIGSLPLLFSVQFLAWLAFFPNALRGHADFRQLYAAGYLLRTGHSHELYDYGLQRKIQDSLVSDDERALPFSSGSTSNTTASRPRSARSRIKTGRRCRRAARRN